MAEYQPEAQDALNAAVADIDGRLGRMVAEGELAREQMFQAERYPPRLEIGIAGGQGAADVEVDEIDAMEEGDLLAVVRTELDRSLDGVDSELSGNWQLALKYYEGSEEGIVTVGCIDDDTGKATVTSLDVADVVEGVMAQVMPSLEGDAIFRFGAIGTTDQELKQDESRAEDESEVVNWELMSRNNGYIVLQSMLRDAMLMRAGVTKVTTEDRVSVESTEYEGLQPIELQMLAADPQVRVMRDGDKIVVNRYTQERRLVVDPVPPEELKLTGSWRSPYLDGIPFIAHRRIMRRGELVEMGYDKDLVDSIPTCAGETNSVTVVRSQNASEDQFDDDIPGNEPVMFSECYIRVDYDGDGLAEQRKVAVGGDSVMMENVPVAEQPFSMAVPILRPHRMTGWSMFDRQKQVQDTKTEALRQHLDNLRWCNMPDMDVVKSQVSEVDVLSRRPGGVNRMTTAGAIQRNTPIPVGQDALNFLDYMDKVRSERGGASLDMQSAQLQIAGDSAHGVERQVSSKELMATFLASTMIQTGVVPMVKKIHGELRRNGGGQVQARAMGSNRAIQADPGQWPKREEVAVVNAVTLGDQMRRQQALQGVVAGQQALMEKGQDGVLVDLQGMYHAMIDAAKNSKLSNPEQYFVDPSSPEAQQAMQAKAQQAQQAQQMQQQQMMAQNQLLIQLETIRAESANQREQIKFLGDRLSTAEDARQADQKTAVDLTDLELKYMQNVPGSKV